MSQQGLVVWRVTDPVHEPTMQLQHVLKMLNGRPMHFIVPDPRLVVQATHGRGFPTAVWDVGPSVTEARVIGWTAARSIE